MSSHSRSGVTVHLLTYPETPHLETELEIIEEELDAGERVLVLTCSGQLQYCNYNPSHDEETCRRCWQRTKDGLSRLSRKPRTKPIVAAGTEQFPLLEQDALVDLRHEDIPVGIGAVSDLISRYGYRFETASRQPEVQRMLTSQVQIVNSLRSVLPLGITRITLFNGRFSQYRTAIEFARAYRIAFRTHERGGSSESYVVRENYLPHDIPPVKDEVELLWKTIPDAERVAESWFQERRNRVQQSWIVFTKNQVEGQLPMGFDTRKRNISIFNSTIEEYETMDCWKNHIFANEIVGLQLLTESFSHLTDFHFYVRLHPNLANFSNGPQMRAIRAMSLPQNFTLILPHETIHSYALMDNCEKVMCFGSTIGCEATFWGKPSILMGRSLYQDLGATYNPSSLQEILDLVIQPLPPKPKSHALSYGLWEKARGRRFRHFVPEGLVGGTFKGHRLDDRRWIEKAFERLRDTVRMVRDKFARRL